MEGLFTIDGLPAHPLLVAAVAVLLPLAAVCASTVALHGGLRRRYGLAVLVLTGVAVLAVPLAQASGRTLAGALGPAAGVLARHEALGEQLLPYALGFGVAVLFLAVSGRLADRERAASQRAARDRAETNTGALTLPDDAARTAAADGAGTGTVSGAGTGTDAVPTTWRRLSVVASVLVIGLAVLTTVDVVRIGTTGAQAQWQGGPAGAVKRQIR